MGNHTQDGSMDAVTQLALKVGEVAGAMGVVASEVSAARTDITGLQGDLGRGASRMTAIEDKLEQLVDQQKIANGRTGKNEKSIKDLQGKWDRVTFVPRTLDKLAEHKVLGLVLTVPLTSALTIVAIQLFT